MAFSFGAESGGRRRFRGRISTMSDINVVPLVDVVLVLLIIFMLTAHVMEFGLDIKVPKVTQSRSTAQELPVISITKDGETYLNDKLVNINVAGQEIKRRFARATAVYVRADKATSWDPIAQVISALGQAKLEVKVVTQPADEGGGRRR